MKHSEKARVFLEKVTSRIRSEEAKRSVEDELAYHIEETKARLLKVGHTEEEAEAEAVSRMGDPALIGREMHKIHKPKVDWMLISLFIMVLAAGIIPFYFLDPPGQLGVGQEYFRDRKIIAAIISIFTIALFMFIDYRLLAKWWPPLFAVALLLSWLILVSGHTINGVSFLELSSFSITIWPISLLFIFSFAGMMARLQGKRQFVMSLIMLWLPVFIIAAAPQLQLALFYFITILVLAGLSSMPEKMKAMFWTANIVLSVSAVLLSFLTAPPHYRLWRFQAFLNPDMDTTGAGYIPNILQQITNQSVWIGPGPSAELMASLPEAHTDMILASIIGQLGWLPALAVILIISLVMARLMAIMKKSGHPLGTMIAAAGISMTGFSVLWNTGMVLGWLPVIGVSLPFISYAVSHQVVYSVFIGMALSVYRRKDLVRSGMPEKPSQV